MPPSQDHGSGIFERLSSGAPQLEIMADYPQLENDGFLAVHAYSAELTVGRTGSKW